MNPPSHPNLAAVPLPAIDSLVIATERFLDAVAAIQSRGFTVPELDAILTANLPANDGPLPDDTSLASILTTLRAAVQAIYQQTASTTDEKGELTRKALALLGWDSALVAEAVDTLTGTIVYAATLDALPSGLTLPRGMPIQHLPAEEGQPGSGRLRFTGPMTTSQLQTLRDLPGADQVFQGAVEVLFTAPRTFVATRMKALRLPIYSVPLDALPSDFTLPTALTGKVFYDVSEKALRSRAYLSEADLGALEAASKNEAYQKAVASLRTAQQAPPAADNGFLTTADAAAMFDLEGVNAASRFRRVLEKANPYLRRTLSEITVKQQIGQAARLDAVSADVLLGTWLRTPSKPTALQDFLAPRFVGSDPAVAATRQGFSEQFVTLDLVFRVSLVLSRLGITAEQIPWVFAYAATAGWLDLNTLPPTPITGPAPLFARFIRLINLAKLRDGIPGHARTLQAVFSTARVAGVTLEEIIAEVSERTGWSTADLDIVIGEELLDMTTPAQFYAEDGVGQLLAAVNAVRRLGVSAERAASWLPIDLTPEAAHAAWQAAKARHSLADWPGIGGPLRDKLRDRQRAALVDYLIANPKRNSEHVPYWHDTNTLLDYFLIDVEMGSCQLTTRIAQAIFSVQLYVQRIQLNLEDVWALSDANLWKRWEWMKTYRVWEANQKIFLYPENYFEPDLRLGKSPQFLDFENELMQKEVTAESCEIAFQRYLQQLDKIAHMRPVGVHKHIISYPYSETLHVFARTEANPGEYYFRSWKNRSTWTPWSKVDLDIENDAVMPIVWNDRLYLFWPSFVQEQVKAAVTMPEPNKELKDPKTYWKIYLNWSRYTDGRWEAKKVSPEFLETMPRDDVWEDIRFYSFVPEYEAASGDLLIWAIFRTKEFVPGTLVSGVTSGNFRLSARRNTLGTLFIYTRPAIEDGGIYDGPRPLMWPDGAFLQFNEMTEIFDFPHATQGEMHVIEPTDVYPHRHNKLLLNRTPGETGFRLIRSHQHNAPEQRVIYFFTDGTRTYLLDGLTVPTGFLDGQSSPLAIPRQRAEVVALSSVAELSNVGRGSQLLPSEISSASSVLGADTLTAELEETLKYKFLSFYHPHSTTLLGMYDRDGLTRVFSRKFQLEPGEFTGPFSFDEYVPEAQNLLEPYPAEPVEYTLGDAYAEYNWELFFHVPLLIAQRLSANQHFADAQEWFHRIFDPTNRDWEASPPQRYWITKPFYQASDAEYQSQRIEDILKRLASGNPEAEAAVNLWLDNPFQPDVVARLRTTAYQKAVVMKYLDNLIAWGDQLFRQDTLESINQATQLYILADELLGRRPDEVTGRTATGAQSFRQLLSNRQQADEAIIGVENLLSTPDGDLSPSILPPVNLKWLTYFCIPRNEKLVGYWDTVEDRLFKIRNCQNIEGVKRQVALFGAPIDPALLVRAAAAGVDLSTVLDDISAPLPYYRFSSMATKAKELASEVRAFGSALLSALEKRDSEALARLRSGHEIAVLDAVRQTRIQQIQEAVRSLESAQKSKDLAESKRKYYAGREYMNTGEETQTKMADTAHLMQWISAGVQGVAAVLSMFPEVKVGCPTTIGVTFGGQNLNTALSHLSGGLNTMSQIYNSQGSIAATLGGYDRRAEDWAFQADQAKTEITQADKNIAAAQIRQAIAEKELESHDKQRDNAREADRFLRSKYTNTELYEWMVGQLSTTYFQAYQLAYDVAKRAERAYRHELAVEDTTFITFGYWDSLHKGLLAGERLSADLNRMDAAYLEINAREFELSKRISLAQLDPDTLLRLKETGTCFLRLPEAIFDVDCPGHYQRRIKNLAITVPCVAGPYTSVNLTARLLNNTVRVNAGTSDGKYARNKAADPRFRDYAGPVQSIVTSAGQEDTGLFEANLRDERFLPFEGAGVISEWQLSLPEKFRQFDYESITDVVLHLRYTARDGGDALAGQVVKELDEALNKWVHAGGAKGLARVFSVRREFSDQWSRFLAFTGDTATVSLALSKTRFPQLFRDRKITLRQPQVVLVFTRDLVPDGTNRYVDAYADGGQLTLTLTTPTGQKPTGTLTADSELLGQPRCVFGAISGEISETEQNWIISVPRVQIEQLATPLIRDGHFNPDALDDLLLICQYAVDPVEETP